MAASNDMESIVDFIDGVDDGDIINTEIINELETGDTDLMRDGGGLGVVNPQDIKKVEEKIYPVEPEMDPDPALHVNDLPVLLYAEIERKGIAGHHISSMNSFYKTGIKQILTKIFKIEVQRMKNLRDKTEEDRMIDYISFVVEFTDVNLTPPTTVKYRSGVSQMLTPNMARIKGLTYSAQLYVSFKVTATAHLKNGKTWVREEKHDSFRIASIPVMVRSEVCNTSHCTRDTLKELEEDPLNPGGMFIVKGGEWAVDNLENILINGFHVYRNQHLNEIARGEFISKPGDHYENSIYIILKYLNNGAITFVITTSKFDKLEIPFYLLFRAFGMTRDRDIIDHIVYGVENDDPITTKMVSILERAFRVPDANFDPIRTSNDSALVISFIAQKMHDIASGSNYKKDDNAVRFLNNSTYIRLDKYIFPHIGSDPSLRMRKLRFLGHLIHRLLRVYLGVLEPTDRDSYSNKRVHGAGVSLAKSFKTQVNFIIVQEVRKHLIKDFKSTPFRQVPLVDSVKAAVNTSDLERLLVQAITSGNKTITVKRNEVTNRVSSQTVYHKNDLNLKSTLNTINTMNSSAAKQNERADEMRRVHPTMLGFIGVTQSADTGEKVGMSKQMACSCSVTEASSSESLKLTLYEDPHFIPLDSITDPADIMRLELTKIFVNGDWIGFCKNGHRMAWRYRQSRRHGDIHPYTTVVWEPLIRELKFWVDVGRLIRPLLIVYNNIEEYVENYKKWAREGGRGPEPVFKQWIKLTKEHIKGLQEKTITMEDLRQQRIIEYITPEEQENAWLAPSYDVLISKKNDPTYQFTHCDIELAIFGLVELSAPNTNHSPASRITMFTNQKKQTCGWFALNWPFRIDKNVFLQYYCDMPLIRVFSDNITYPNGQNIIIAYQMYAGVNQEDSALLNRASVERGLFNGCFFRYEKSEQEKGESFGNPDYARTIDIKKDANYGFIENGLVREGTVVKRGDVLIVKSAKIPQPTDQYLYTDKSTVYKYPEPSFVEKVIVTRNDEDVPVAKVKLRSERKIVIGDKLCLSPDHDVLTACGWRPISEITMDDEIATLGSSKELEYHRPYRVYSYDHNGEMYEIKTRHINQCVTLNHRMYVKLRSGKNAGDFQLIAAEKIMGRCVQYKKNALNVYLDTPVMTLTCPGCADVSVSMDDWLVLLGALVSYGWADQHCQDLVYIFTADDRRHRRVDEVCSRMGIEHWRAHAKTCIKSPHVKRVVGSLGVEKHLPDYVWRLSQRQCRVLLSSLWSLDGSSYSGHHEMYYTSSKRLADDIMRLSLHAGWSGSVSICAMTARSGYCVSIEESENEPVANDGHTSGQNWQIERRIPYNGRVYCVEVPNHVFYVRREGVATWTGNSSRNGNKSIVAAIWPAADMPYTEDGLIPDVVINPHGIPTRMVIGQIMETTMSELAVKKGVFMSADAFRRIDMKAIINELEKRGVKFGGHRRMYNGRTGNWFDTLIFIGPVGYQRLQKFVVDESYAVSTGPTSALTRQPLDGKINEGGLRIGEMEKDVYCANSCMRALHEKFYAHSDGIDIPICRICGDRAVINEKHSLYRCRNCKDNADICLVPASWVSNIFYTEISAMNLKPTFELTPYEYSMTEEEYRKRHGSDGK